MNAWISWIAWAALVGLIAWRTWIALRAAGRQTDRIIRETLEPAHLAAQVDDLELLWNVPAYQQPDPDLDAGCDRLWNAIQDHREEEGL